MTKYIFITGGNVSSLGKGITSASVGRLLKSRGLRVVIIKIDPYLNVDAGTMNPFQHGEVYVTDDGAETDLDLGHYERFTDQDLTQDCNITTGRVYDTVIRNERAGKYLGGTIQVIPHITNEIKQRIRKAARGSRAEVAIVEVGGTVGDIEGQPFYEALRQFRNDIGRNNGLNIHLSLVPYVGPAAELKTKLTQHTVKELRGIGIQPDIIVCRTKYPLKDDLKAKISLFCDVPKECVIAAQDTPEIYEIPMIFDKQNICDIILDKLDIVTTDENEIGEWVDMVNRLKHPENGKVTIGIIGKYIQLKDAYISIHEAIKHGGIANSVEMEIKLIDANRIEKGYGAKTLKKLDGILVPGGFGYRGIEGKIKAIQYARENNIPFLGICLGLQSAVIEFARNIMGLEGANSSEFDEKTPHPVIDLMLKQRGITDKGGTMRLGAYPCKITKKTIAHNCYGKTKIDERHRHRYEFNNDYRKKFEKAGMVFSGINPGEDLVEIIEIPDHRFFFACQFHPEFKSRPTNPSPPFAAFVGAALDYAREKRK